ncbi:hypothetical protein HY632_04385 [Candidatus Uhrbacteria bacterium]|nr:hypothetical protein [Candidatus Uhrbacteria bacterium]
MTLCVPAHAVTKKPIVRPVITKRATPLSKPIPRFTSERQVYAAYKNTAFASLPSGTQKALCKEITRGHPRSYTIGYPTPAQAKKLQELYGGCQKLAQQKYQQQTKTVTATKRAPRPSSDDVIDMAP